jgi:hypothetical protein
MSGASAGRLVRKGGYGYGYDYGSCIPEKLRKG